MKNGYLQEFQTMAEKGIRQISIRLPGETYLKAMDFAKKKGMSFNSLISQLVSDFFEKESETFVRELLLRFSELEKRVEKLENK